MVYVVKKKDDLNNSYWRYYKHLKFKTVKNIMKRASINVILLLLTCLLLNGCADDEGTPEQQVRKTLDAIELASEERSMSDLMDFVAEDYSDHQGNDKNAIRRVMQLLFLRNQSINIFSLVRSIDITNDVAAVELSAAMAARGVDLSLETNRLKADTHRFSILLKQTEGDWLIQSVSWQQGWSG